MAMEMYLLKSKTFCQAADKISEDYGCEILYKVENSGTPEDIENIKKAIGA